MVKLTESLVSSETAARVENAGGKSEVVLICEHAGQQLPDFVGSLGVDEEVMSTHIAWDLGAAALARLLSAELDATLILQRYSRLVYDCNRSFEARDAIVERSDDVVIPGNTGITNTQRQQRYDNVYLPFCQAINELVQSRVTADRKPVIVTLHSFTPLYKGQQRTLDLGVIHDDDARFADSLLSLTEQQQLYRAARNEPYSAKDGTTHTLITHGVKNRLLNVMFEIRNDLISDLDSQQLWSQRLAKIITASLVKTDRD